jgi:hypothetical protein
MKVHLNWSRTKNWDLTRSKLTKHFSDIAYGNFMDFETDKIPEHPDFDFIEVKSPSYIMKHYEVRDKNPEFLNIIKAKDLQLADIIRPKDLNYKFMDCTVKQIKEDIITLFRPYVATADFSYTGGVLCYIGIDEYNIYRDEREYFLVERKNLR